MGKRTIIYWIWTFVWIAFFALFVAAMIFAWRVPAVISLAAVAVGPTIFYPVVYFRGPEGKRDTVKSISEIWMPFWAAVAAFCLVCYDKHGPETSVETKPLKIEQK